EIANYLLNEKRRALAEIESRHDVPLVIVADDQLETPHFNVQRIREGELGEESSKPSYHRTSPRKQEIHALTRNHLNIPDLPAVTAVAPTRPAPVRDEADDAPAAPAPVETRRPAAKPAARGNWWTRMLAALGFAPADAGSADRKPASKPGDDRGERKERRGERG